MQRFINRLDQFQQRHQHIAFIYAVIKKFGDDQGGYQAALLTYYGFLSLFPLLLVLFTILQIVFKHNSAVQHQVATSINEYLPIVGPQLQQDIHSIRAAGIGLVIGLIVALYGVRGAADALRNMLNNVWQVPRNRRAGFPKSLFQSLTIIAGAAVGFSVLIAVSLFSSVLGHAQWLKIVANLCGFVVATATLLFVCNRATSRRVPINDMLLGTVGGAWFIQLLVTFGGLLVRHQLRGANSLYGTFAVVLGLLFWIYLIAQTLVYAAEIDSVRHLKLWPRAIQADKLTEADLQAYKLYANVQSFMPRQRKNRSFRH